MSDSTRKMPQRRAKTEALPTIAKMASFNLKTFEKAVKETSRPKSAGLYTFLFYLGNLNWFLVRFKLNLFKLFRPADCSIFSSLTNNI